MGRSTGKTNQLVVIAAAAGVVVCDGCRTVEPFARDGVIVLGPLQ